MSPRAGDSGSAGAGHYDFALVRYNANGTLDFNFDGDGRVTTDFTGRDDLIGAIAVLTTTKILAAGSAETAANGNDFALARYNPDGSPDTGFSGNGRVVTEISGDDQALDMVVLPDGKICWQVVQTSAPLLILALCATTPMAHLIPRSIRTAKLSPTLAARMLPLM